MHALPADILQEYRKPFNQGHIHVGWCRAAQAWRWRIVWAEGKAMDWSVAPYAGRNVAHAAALKALQMAEAVL